MRSRASTRSAYLRQLAMVRPDGDFLAVGGPLDGSLFRDVEPAAHRRRPGAPAGGARRRSSSPNRSRARRGSRLGDTVPVQGFTQEQIGDISSDTPAASFPNPAGPKARLRVVGISRLPIDLSLQGRAGGVLILQRSFVEKYGADIGNFSGETGGVLFVRLTDGEAGVDRFLGQLRRVLGERQLRRRSRRARASAGSRTRSTSSPSASSCSARSRASPASSRSALIISRQVALLAAGQAAVRDLGHVAAAARARDRGTVAARGRGGRGRRRAWARGSPRR